MTKNRTEKQSDQETLEEILASVEASRVAMLTAIRRMRYAAANLATTERGA